MSEIFQEANVIAMSECDGITMTTMHFREWRPIHSELMTHRALSKSAGSSRARPSAAISKQVRDFPMMPVEWGANEPGMKATKLLDPLVQVSAQEIFREAAAFAADAAERLATLGVHKQIVNRIQEPYTYIDVLVSGTEWNNFFHLRDHEDADPTMRDLAVKAKIAMEKAIPTMLKSGEWHLPYITCADWAWAKNFCKFNRVTRDEPTYQEMVLVLRKISTARCARVSYKLFDGTTDHMKDLELYEKLMVSQPLHASPSEHQACPMTTATIKFGKDMWDHYIPDNWENGVTHVDRNYQFWSGNLRGWIQHRQLIDGEHVTG